ncbi:MAG: pantoate--beta-alanine ligase [Gammaproteobacteria bacterium]
MGSPALLSTVAAARSWRAMRSRAGASVAMVPTMGNLHAGHATLINVAKRTADFVIVSVFVNPTQFGLGEDFASYPRTLEQDHALAGEHEADAVFAPNAEALYPNGLEQAMLVQAPPELAGILCGAQRPGHFTGVASVVTRLLNIVHPEYALFGEKDYQQLMVIRRLAQDLFIDTDIVSVPTVRESDGLALSSRNQYLTADERQRAPALYRALSAAAEAIKAGAETAAVEAQGRAALTAAGFRPEYFEVRHGANLGPPQAGELRVILAAGWLGKARLIDNIKID